MEVPFNTSPEPQDPKPIAAPAPAVPPPAPIIAAKPPEVDMPSMPQADMSAVQLWVHQFQKSADAQRAEHVKSFRAAVAENPDQAAKKVAVAKELGLDPTDPSQDWKIAEQFSKQREIERQAFDWKYPELAAKMREWDFAAQAYDDLGNLQNIEGLWQWIKANWNQGQMMVERGQIGTRIAMGWSSQEDLERLEEINNAKKLPERTGLAYGIFGGTSEVLGQMSETLPASLAAAGAAVGVSAVAPPAGIITGPTAFLLTQGIQTAQIEGGNAYLDYLEAGLGEDEAKTSAFFVGVFNGAVETALGKFALKPFTSLGNKIGGKVMPKVFQPVTAQSGLADMLKAYALGVAGEVVTETVQEISQIAGQELATMYSREELDLLISTQDGRQQIYDRLGNIIAKTTMSMAVLGLPGPMANFMVDMQRAEAAKADTQIIKAISQGVKDARLAERNPQLAKEFVETAQGEAVTEVFINSETLRSRLTAIDQKATKEGKLQKSAFDVLREKLPEVSKQLDLAVGSNDTIRIKTSEMATQLAKSDVLSILMDDVRIDPNGMSMNEAIEYQPHIQKMAGQMKVQISEKAQQDKAFRESANRLRSQFVSQIVAAGRPLEQARIAANLQTMFVMRMVTTENAANGSSMLPEEWHAMHGMTTGAAETAAPIARPPLWLPKVVQDRKQAATAQPEQITPEAGTEVAPSEPVALPAQELTPYEQALDILTDPNAQITPEQRAELEQYVQQAESQTLRSITPDEDATYLAAVEAGDMETAQRMVYEAAKRAGYTMRGFHGTNADFTAFRVSRIGNFGPGVYLSFDETDAREYARRVGGSKVLQVVIRATNPFRIKNALAASDFFDLFPAKSDAESVAKAQASGYDAVLAEQDATTPFGINKAQISVFDPSQVKSADPVTRDAQGNVIPLSQRFDTAKDSILYSRTPLNAEDTAYLAAVEAGDMETAQRMVDRAAKRAGYKRKLWHGTTATTEAAKTASSSTGDQEQQLTQELLELGAKFGFAKDIAYSLERQLEYFPDAAKQQGITQEVVTRARSLKNALKELQRKTSSRPVRQLEFDVFNFPSDGKELGVHLGNQEQAEMFGDAFPFFVDLRKPLRLPDLGTWGYQSVMRAARKAGVSISESEYESVLNASDNNAALRELLMSKGYDGVVYKNEAEGTGDSFIVFAPRQVKLADPVTRDAQGNVIPLSQRFDQTKDSILYSRTPLNAEDTAYLAAVEAGDLETAQRMVDEAANKAGFNHLSKAYHGSPEKGFDTFLESARGGATKAKDAKLGFFFAHGSEGKDYAENFTYRDGKQSGDVRAFYLRNPNPYYYDHEGEYYRPDAFLKAVKEARDNGYSGVIIANVKSAYDDKLHAEEIVFDPSQIKSADPVTRDAQGNVIPLSQRFDRTKDSILYSQQPEAGVGGTYERLTRRTLLNSNATPATWFHELMHYMFDTYADMIRRGVATEAMQKDFQALLEFAKFEGDFAAYSSANRDQQRVVHETVAYGWEQWLYEGKQMPFQLRKLMTTITQFFRSAWEGLKQINDAFFVETGQNLPGLTDEVRQVFSRMVAGEDQAKLAESTRAAVPLFLSREQWVAFGNPAEDWDLYMNEERNRLDEAAAQLTRMGIDALAIFSGTKDDRLKKLQKQYKEVRETMREEANSEVGLRKVYRLRQFLKNGTMVDAEGIEKTEKQQVFKMDRKMLLDIPAAFDVLRETAAKAVIAAESKLKALVSNEPRRLLVLPEKPRNVDPLAPEGVFDLKAVEAWELEVQRIKALNADNVAANAERLVLIKKARKELAKAKQVQRRVTKRLKTRENAIQERSPLDDYIKEGGLDPNIVRELFGYTSVEEMVKELLNAPEFDEAVNKLIDLRMLREYGDLTSAEAMEEAVNMSLVNEHNTRWLTMELRTLERKMRGGANTPSDIEQQKQAAQQLAQMQTELEQLRAKRAAAKEAQDTAAVAAAETEIAGLKEQMKDVKQAADGALSMRIMRAAAREAARQVLSQRGIASIKPGLSQAAERRSSRDALTKLTNNDLPGAIQAKREQLLHNQMAAEAAEIQRYYKRTLKWFNSFFRKKDKSVAKGRSLEHVYAIRAILLAFGLGGTASQRSKRIADANMWLERLQKYEPTRYAEIKSLVEQAAKENKAVGTLTLEEFRRLESNVRTLWAEAEREKSIEIDGQKVLVEDAVASITDRASKLARTGALPGENKAITKKETAIGALHALRSSMRRAESLFDSWDGSEPGVFTKYFWRPLHKAIGTYRMSRDKYYKRYVQILKDLQPHLTSGPIAAQKYIKYDWTDMQELVAALTHTGNLSNKAKLLLGGRPNNPWATLNEDTGTVDSSRWEQMIADYVAAGILKQEHFDAVQAIWDLMEEMKPDIQRVYRTRFGTFFNEVPAEAFTITFADGTTKTYRGGYVPAKVDRDLVYNVFDPASVEEVNQEFRDSMPTTGWGFTITRMAGYNKPLDLDLSRVMQHIESVQRFVHIQPALWNVTRLLRDERVLQAFNSIDPTVLPNTIQPWLEKVASQRTGKSSSIPLLDKTVRWLRNNAGMAIMFGNISNTMQQLTGILLGAVKVKGSYLRGSLKRIVFASQETRRRIYGEISEKSQYMDQRFRTQIFDLQEQMNEVLINPSKFQKIQSWAKQHAYFMQQYVQNIVDAAVWSGAYEQAIADGQTEQEAVYRADAAVSLTQGGVQPEQISAIEGGQEWARLMTQFTGYFNMMANLNGTQFKKIVREVGWNNGKKELFHAWMLGFAAPTIAAGIIAKTWAGKWDDEDDDGYADETGLWLLDVLGRGALSMLPLGSSVMAVTINRMDDQTYNDRMMSAPAISMLERMGESLLGPSGFVRAVLSSEKDITGRKIRDVFSILDMVAGIPVSGIASKLAYAIESMTGTQQNYNWADAIRGSVTGISSEGTRQK